MFPLVRLGRVLLQTAGLALLLSFWLGSTLAEREARRLGVEASSINTGIFVAVITGLLWAQLAYVARYASTYLANPASVFSLSTSALSVPPGVVVGALSAGFYWWRMRLRPTLEGGRDPASLILKRKSRVTLTPKSCWARIVWVRRQRETESS